jgi:hypothetical protein
VFSILATILPELLIGSKPAGEVAAAGDYAYISFKKMPGHIKRYDTRGVPSDRPGITA